MNKNRPEWQKILFRVLKEHGAFKAYENGIKQLGTKFWSEVNKNYLQKLFHAKSIENEVDTISNSFV